MAEENKMSIYEVTDEKTGVTLQLEGMGPPTKEQVDAIFANHYKNNPKEPTGFDPRVLAAQLAGPIAAGAGAILFAAKDH